MGYDREDFAGKPVIAVVNTWSEINPCHTHLRDRAQDVKRGVWQAGGFPVEVPAISLSEPFMKPSTMLYRNLLAMETEELLAVYPFDGAVLLGGCDKTTPALIMGALSMGLPFIFVPCGPMMRARWRGETLGSGSDVWKYWAELRAGNITQADWDEIEERIASTPGHCMTMGTASTMTSAAEALGVTLPGAASIPAADSDHPRMAVESGRRIVALPASPLTRRVVRERDHGRAGAGRVHERGHPPDRDGRPCRRSAVAGPLRRALPRRPASWPTSARAGKYLMQDFFEAGGLRGADGAARPARRDDRDGRDGLARTLAGAEVFDDDVIRPRSNPLCEPRRAWRSSAARWRRTAA